MRLPLKGSEYLCTKVNPSSDGIQQAYLESISPAIKAESVNAMLGDGTITKTDTFDPVRVRGFYQRLSRGLQGEGWSCSEISTSETDDLRRIFFGVRKDLGKYHLVGYFGIQYHALPYYRVDKRVMEIQKELSGIADEASRVFGNMSGAADKAIQLELQKKGYADLEFQELFTRMFEDEKLVEELDSKSAAVEAKFPEFEKMRMKKTELFEELNNLLMETYQTSAVSIDHNRQLQGEEGVTTYFDLEVIRNQKTGVRDAFINATGFPEEWADKLADELDKVALILKKLP